MMLVLNPPSLLGPPLPSGVYTGHHHYQSLFIHEIISFYIVFLGIVFKLY